LPIGCARLVERREGGNDFAAVATGSLERTPPLKLATDFSSTAGSVSFDVSIGTMGPAETTSKPSPFFADEERPDVANADFAAEGNGSARGSSGTNGGASLPELLGPDNRASEDSTGRPVLPGR
jgi:hypothetical protein